MQACVLYPNIPIFPATPPVQQPSSRLVTPTLSRPSSSQLSQSGSQHKKTAHNQQPFPPSATAGLFARAEANPNATMNFIRKIAPGKSGKNSTTPPVQQEF